MKHTIENIFKSVQNARIGEAYEEAQVFGDHDCIAMKTATGALFANDYGDDENFHRETYTVSFPEFIGDHALKAECDVDGFRSGIDFDKHEWVMDDNLYTFGMIEDVRMISKETAENPDGSETIYLHFDDVVAAVNVKWEILK